MVDFLSRVFEPSRFTVNATLRGFYFTSGTQEGTPIDQLIGALSEASARKTSPPQPIRAGAEATSLGISCGRS